MNRSFAKGVAVGLFLAFIASTFVIWLMVRDRKLNIPYGRDAMSAKLEEIQEKIDLFYYGDDYNMEDLYQGAYAGYVSGLNDKYSVYYNPEQFESLKESTSGTYVGIGVYIGIDAATKYPIITHVLPLAGAERAGVKDNDLLIKVDGVDLQGKELKEVSAMVKGEAETTVVLTIRREGESDTDYEVKRRVVDVETVSYEMLDNNVGYIKVTAFDGITISQFDVAVNDLKEGGAKSLIIDLRDNTGGMIDTAVAMCDKFLDTDMVVTYTVNKWDKRSDFLTTTEEAWDVPIAILINEKSASASEILAGCMKDYMNAVLIGEKSFGKGIVQSLIPLHGDDTVLKLTTGKYYSPNGTNIHGTGYEPDIPAVDDPETENDEVIDAAINELLKK